ncbi:hypothetical protein B7P43_G06015 [Cryptotermes secundus]|uniref:Uncharacterized protein n=1 Tax=Cryptotermes secundus TaxID=105785 RepID=A0A2J7QZD4_9NEOP|nr:hypothetical protein B7P43_G06015 [Cryptotermes secundus]
MFKADDHAVHSPRALPHLKHVHHSNTRVCERDSSPYCCWSLVNFSGQDIFSKEFDHNALFHAPQYLLFAHHSSNSQTGLNRF